MSGRSSSALPAALAAAGVLLAAGAWFLAGEGGRSPGTVPPIPAPAPPPPPPRDGTAPADPPVPAPPPSAPDGDPAPTSTSAGPWNLPPLSPRAAPWAFLRFLDDGTGDPVPASAHPAVILVAPTDRGVLRLPEKLHAASDGRAAVVPVAGGDRPGENLHFTAEEREAHRYEVHAFGYAPLLDLRRADLEGERDLRLVPVVPAARGVLEAGPGLGKGVLRCELVPGARGTVPAGGAFFNDGPGSRVPPLPRDFGPFTIPALGAGSWTLVVRHQQEGGVQARAVATFEAGAGTVDLGTLVVRAPATIRARVIGADGTGMLDRGLRVRRAGGASEEGLPVAEPDAAGWVEFRGLENDADYEVLCSFEGVTETVRTPLDGGTPLVVELRSEIRGVRCRIRFTVKGEEPIQWGAIFAGPTLDETAWKKDGLLEQEMAPGEYSLGILARPPGAETMSRWFATFTVPDQPQWETTIDLGER